MAAGTELSSFLLILNMTLVRTQQSSLIRLIAGVLAHPGA
jgi:hypothetical protein